MLLSLLVCLLATMRKISKRICMKFSGKVVNGPMNTWLNVDGDPVHSLDKGLFSVFVTIGRYEKWLTDINLLLVLIRTGKVYLGGCMHCPSASSFILAL